MAFDGTLKFDTAIDQTGFQSGLSGLTDMAKSGLSGLGNIAKASMAAVTSAVSAVSGEVLNLGRSAVDVGMNFESGMSQVIATMGITKDTIQDGVNSYELLSQAAQDAGASTTFSATEAAGALNFLALAGYDAATAADSLPAVLNLAAAGGLQLQYAADLATDAMAALGIEASNENLTHFGDQMAITASKANTSVGQLGEAILTVGGTAKSLSGGVAEMNAALGVLANRGIKGSEGGTALRNMILSLTAPTDKAAAVLKELGVEVYDAEHKMRPLNEVFRDLKNALPAGYETQVLNEIFNKVDLKSAQAMLAGCGEEFDNLTAALNECDGAMQQMADTMNDTLEGDIKSLQSKAEALGITVYQSLNDPLRELTQLGTSYIGQLTAAFQSGGLEGAAEAVGGILGDAVAALAGYLPDVTGIGSRVVASLLEGIAANSGSIIGTGLDMGLKMLSGFGDITVNFLDLGANLASSLASGIETKLPQISGTSREILLRITKALGDSLPVMLESGADIVEMLAGALTNDLPRLTVFGNQAVRQIAEAIRNSLPDILQAGTGLIGAFGTSILDSLPVLLDAGVQILNAVVGTIADPEGLSSLIGTATLIVNTLGGALLDNVQPLLNAGAVIITALISALAQPDSLTELLGAGLQIITQLVDILVQNVDPLTSAAVQILTVLGTALLTNIPVLLGAGLEVVRQLMQAFSDPDALTELLDAGLQIITSFSEILMENLSPLLAAVIAIIGTMGEWIGEHALDLAEAGLLIMQTIVEAVIQNLPLLLDASAQIVEGLARGIEDDSADVLLGVEKIIKMLLDFLLSPDTLKKIGETGGRIVRALIPAAVELGGDLLGFALELFEEFDEAMQKVNWSDIGKHIFEGIISGLIGTDFDLENFLADFGENWISGFKEIFGIHSPSRLMRDEIGKNLALGLQEGFEDNLPDMAEQMLENTTDFPEIPIAFSVPESPDFNDIPIGFEMPEIPGFEEEISVSLAEEAADILASLRQPQMPASVDPAALDLMLQSPPMTATDMIGTSPTASVTNNYTTSNSSETVNNSGESSSFGDIIIPVQIGSGQIETIVVTAAQIANARSGGDVF